MKNIITGSQGFIGSNLLKKLGNDVQPIPHELIPFSVLKPFDQMFFLSSYGNLASQKDDAQIYKANIEDLIQVLLQIKEYNFHSFVFVSTSSVKLRTQTTYSRCKKAAEEIILAMMEKHELPIAIIRPFSVTGVGEQEEHLIPTLIDAAFTGQMVNLDPKPTHDFIDVDDITDGILSLSSHGARGIFELGTGIKTTNMEVLNLVQEVTGKKIKVNFVENIRPYDNDNWVSTNFKARMFGWLPQKTLKQSIEEMVKAYAVK